jgi:hypothetical protein
MQDPGQGGPTVPLKLFRRGAAIEASLVVYFVALLAVIASSDPYHNVVLRSGRGRHLVHASGDGAL